MDDVCGDVGGGVACARLKISMRYNSRIKVSTNAVRTAFERA